MRVRKGTRSALAGNVRIGFCRKLENHPYEAAGHLHNHDEELFAVANLR